MMDLSEIKLRLDVDTAVQHLFPNAKRAGREWLIGSLNGEAGNSLKIRSAGDKAGVWSDFSTGETGDIIDLWKGARNSTLSSALGEIKEFLGIKDPVFHPQPRKQYVRPEKPQCKKPTDAVLDYLVNTRGLTQETIDAFKVAADGDKIIFPFLKNGELLMWKSLSIQRDAKGKKLISGSKDPEPCLFGWQALNPETRTVCLTEGELDAMSLHQLGFPALSIHSGVSNHHWIQTDFEALAQFETIYICFDQDEPGQKAAMEVACRLGLHRVKLVEIPFKDANEGLLNGLDSENMAVFLQFSESIDPEELKRGDGYLKDLERLFYPNEEENLQSVLPWRKTHQNIQLRPGELSIWTGINGHGKSQALGHVMVDLMAKGHKVCIASMEIKPARLLYRLVRQAGAIRVPSQEYLAQLSNWFGDKLWLFDVVGTAKADRILEVFEFARKKYGVSHFVVDSLMKCGIAEDDYKGQKLFVDKLCDFKNTMNCHIHLVAHSRKGESEHAAPGKLDVKGTGAITDLADNVESVWRNKSKEEEARKEQPDPKKMESPDAVIYCGKQRNGEWEGKIALWFDPDSFQYLESDQTPPKRYVEFMRNGEPTHDPS